MTKEEIIAHFELVPLPVEGGYYRETVRSPFTLPHSVLPNGFGGDRQLSTAIYYLVDNETFAALHKLPGEEIFHFYAGDAVEVLHLYSDGKGAKWYMGNAYREGQVPQLLAPAHCWQGVRLVDGGEFALLGTTMAPAFQFEDHTLGQREALIKLYPDYEEEILKLTR